jgi:hypothetical protein
MITHCNTVLLLVGLVMSVTTGCTTRPQAINADQSAGLRARAEAHFQRGFYLKPAETGNIFTQAWRLAPLFIIEANDALATADLPLPPARPQVFFKPGHITLNGRRHEQMTYWWTYPKNSRAWREALPAQGVRITLNAAGQPVVWETLADTSGGQVIFIAQSLEAQAVQQFGVPLEGRRFAIERPRADAPNVVVARVIEDGPVTMGPIVYLRAGTREVTTVICRCMEAQVRELAGQQEYDLVAARNSPGLVRKLRDVCRHLRFPEKF